MQFEFATAQRIIFGPGTRAQVGPRAREAGSRACLLTGKDARRAQPFVDALRAEGLTVTHVSVSGEPTVDTAAEAVSCARQGRCDLVVAAGGGSTLDTGKVVAALLNNTGDLMTYLEVVGDGRPIQRAPAPLIAVPTTAGTGTEVTRNAVLSVPSHQRKVSMRHAMMLPRLAVIDPELTYSLPPAVTAATGLDALTQLIEPFVCPAAHPLTDGFCREGLQRAARSLPKVYHHGNDRTAREDMALASLCGGLALANAKLGAVHGLAGPIGGVIPVPHGMVCARLLPLVMETTWQALQDRAPDKRARERFGELARLLTGRTDAQAQDGIRWIQTLVDSLEIASLSDFGLTESSLAALVEASRDSSSMKGHPIKLTPEELTDILKRAL